MVILSFIYKMLLWKRKTSIKGCFITLPLLDVPMFTESLSAPFRIFYSETKIFHHLVVYFNTGPNVFWCKERLKNSNPLFILIFCYFMSISKFAQIKQKGIGQSLKSETLAQTLNFFSLEIVSIPIHSLFR